jgi:hypothetical protein
VTATRCYVFAPDLPTPHSRHVHADAYNLGGSRYYVVTDLGAGYRAEDRVDLGTIWPPTERDAGWRAYGPNGTGDRNRVGPAYGRLRDAVEALADARDPWGSA